MKVSKLFHWLYASVMFIPLMILPIFGLAVRSDNNFQPIEVQAHDYDVVDFNQQVNNIGNRELTINEIDVTFNDNKFFILNGTSGNQAESETLKIIELIENHKYIFSGCFAQQYDLNNAWLSNINSTSTETWGRNLFAFNIPCKIALQAYILANTTYVDETFYPQLFDLTQMFGLGNEPTLNEFNNLYPNVYYDYSLSKKELLNVGITTLSDTDVGSQMVYTLYNATDKYFNFNQFLGIGNLFNWFQLNVFNGNAPLGFIIFWNLLIYWLLVSIAWLIFDIAMFVPKLAHRWLDKASLE